MQNNPPRQEYTGRNQIGYLIKYPALSDTNYFIRLTIHTTSSIRFASDRKCRGSLNKHKSFIVIQHNKSEINFKGMSCALCSFALRASTDFPWSPLFGVLPKSWDVILYRRMGLLTGICNAQTNFGLSKIDKILHVDTWETFFWPSILPHVTQFGQCLWCVYVKTTWGSAEQLYAGLDRQAADENRNEGRLWNPNIPEGDWTEWILPLGILPLLYITP